MREYLVMHEVEKKIEEELLFGTGHLQVKEGEVIGIIGKNGAGKSLLLQMIGGRIAPDAGELDWKQEMKLEFVEQEREHYESTETTDKERELLAKFGVPMKKYRQLSGGEKLKMRLARGFASRAPLLLLDEPSNHLDDRSLDLLIELLRGYEGSILLVSHDRSLLDRAATKIWAFEDGAVSQLEGNYSAYIAHREAERKAQQHAYEQQQKKIKRVEGQLANLTAWSEKGHRDSTKQEGAKEYHRKKLKRLDKQVKSKRKKLEQELEAARVDAVKPEYEVEFSLPESGKRGKRLLEVKGVKKSFASETLFEGVNVTMQTGEKVALLGPNGSGKTTFLKMLLGLEAPEAGEIWISPSASIGYLTQEVFDLPLDQTLAQFFYRETYEQRAEVQNLMHHLGFHAGQWEEALMHLSMGERVKCKLMQYILEAKDLLILDEPTNHLDLPSREQLEETLAQYSGAVLVVSHDRYFVDKTTEKVWMIENREIREPFKESAVDESGMRRMQLEREQQEVLGKLSLLKPGDAAYAELDQRFLEILAELRHSKG
ncbi:ribosomal protection-like ABC-F family protein [Planomicrobium sp. YIM 101495]|uniref:ribosomal protection-like ABC-F family protein n=1 Tax=Planomicrobium sp. YIM 101495 TaxID=2665160 RepID=UPI0012B77E66|nr:ABC-F family ATP-binding cassette domain-containing protein [Planomicrobium sp. YIM 101495]MTD31279.1 ATP-binding cassette domain-containing protein [Planomicrobium sp. YIM 101495]